MAVLNITGSADGSTVVSGSIRATGYLTGLAIGTGDTTGILSYRVNISGATGTAGASVLDETLETGVTVKTGLRRILAAVAGRSSGSPSGPVKFRNAGDTRDRVAATVDSSGNRTAIAFDDGD